MTVTRQYKPSRPVTEPGLAWLLLSSIMGLSSAALADQITYVGESGQQVTLEAAMVGEIQDFQLLERADGQIQMVHAANIRHRLPMEPPVPLDASGMIQLIEKRFEKELVRTETKAPFLVALVLQDEIDKSAEARAAAFLKKAARFMANVDNVFLKFAKSMKFPLHEPRYPLVLIIFESDEDFNSFAREATGDNGLTAERILGFYSPLTNWLAVRMASCDTFEVPLHEAIHQQVYNRLFTRFAAVPKWFDEGIAAGFEGSGERIDVHPSRVNPRYARLARELPASLKWDDVIRRDDPFYTDNLASDAYVMGWSLHWMLCTEHSEKYAAYVKELAQRRPIKSSRGEQRIEDFEAAFGMHVSDLQADFTRALESNIRRQKVNVDGDQRPGYSSTQQALANVELEAVRTIGNPMRVQGVLRNISPLRSMTYYVTVLSERSYAEWVIADVRPGQSKPLAQQFATKPSPTLSTTAGTYQLNIRSAPADSPAANAWTQGNLPGPAPN